MEVQNIKKIIIGAFLLSLVPIIFYIANFGTWRLSDKFSDWNSFSGYLSGLLSPFISFLTLLVTVYIAYSLNEYEKRKNKQIKEQDDTKSYLELYKYFSEPEFREKRLIGWNVIKRAIEQPEYADFIVQEAFISSYTNRVSSSLTYNKFKHIYANSSLSESEFLSKESEDRHKLDSIVIFFQLLAVTDVPADNYKVFDFYYDHWRPVLYWYASKLEEGYEKSEVNKKFDNPPNLRLALKLLDMKYYNPQIVDDFSVDNIDEHPVIKCYLTNRPDAMPY